MGKYYDALAVLLRRGLVENADTNSPFFNLRWTTRAQDARNVRVIDRGGLALKIKWKSASHGKTRGRRVIRVLLLLLVLLMLLMLLVLLMLLMLLVLLVLLVL